MFVWIHAVLAYVAVFGLCADVAKDSIRHHPAQAVQARGGPDGSCAGYNFEGCQASSREHDCAPTDVYSPAQTNASCNTQQQTTTSCLIETRTLTSWQTRTVYTSPITAFATTEGTFTSAGRTVAISSPKGQPTSAASNGDQQIVPYVPTSTVSANQPTTIISGSPNPNPSTSPAAVWIPISLAPIASPNIPYLTTNSSSSFYSARVSTYRINPPISSSTVDAVGTSISRPSSTPGAVFTSTSTPYHPSATSTGHASKGRACTLLIGLCTAFVLLFH